MRFPQWILSPYAGTAFRNIATCHPRQDLYDDVTDDPEKLDNLVQASSGIDHLHFLEMHRPFQYGNLDDDLLRVFKRAHWNCGRFGDGLRYGVWYGAEEEMTSICESAYWAYRLAQDNTAPRGEVYSADRTMYQAKLKAGRSVDLTAWKDDLSKLIHPTDYAFCQELGQKAVADGMEMLRSPSARKVGGVCTPVFDAMAIVEASAIDTLHLFVHPDGFIAVNSVLGRLHLSSSASDFENPYSLSQAALSSSILLRGR